MSIEEEIIALRPFCINFARQFTTNYEDAVDIAQDAITSVFSVNYKRIDDLKGWLGTNIKRRGIDYWRIKGGKYGMAEAIKIIDGEVVYNAGPGLPEKKIVLMGIDPGYDEVEVDRLIDDLEYQDQAIVRGVMAGYRLDDMREVAGIGKPSVCRRMKTLREKNQWRLIA